MNLKVVGALAIAALVGYPLLAAAKPFPTSGQHLPTPGPAQPFPTAQANPEPLPMASDSPVVTGAGTGAIDLTFVPCARVSDRELSNGSVAYSVWSGAQDAASHWNTHRSVVWTPDDPAALHQVFTVPAGMYSYQAVALGAVGNARNILLCSYFGYVMVLPGSHRSVVEVMYAGLGYPVPHVFIYGTVPGAYDVSAVHYSSRPKCDRSLSGLTGNPLQIERDEIGYYASDSYASAVGEKGAVFGISVKTKSGSASRTFRAVADYPWSIDSIVPTSVRLDLTQRDIDSAFRSPPGKLLCL